MPLTREEMEELNAIIARGSVAKAKAEDPNTPSPLQQHMDQVDPEGAQSITPKRSVAPSVSTQPDLSANHDINANPQDSTAGLQVPPGAQAGAGTPPPAGPTGASTSAAAPSDGGGILDRIRAAMGGTSVPLSEAQEKAKAGLPVVPVSSQDRVMMDALTRGWGDHVAAIMNGDTKEDERAKTELARLDAGDSAGQFQFAGQVAPYFILGGGVGGLIKTAAVGAGMAMADKTLQTVGQEDRLPEAEELAIQGMYGAGGGAIGNLVGKGMSGLFNRLTHGADPISKFTQRAIMREGKIVKAASDKLDSSGLVVSGKTLGKLGDTIEKKLMQGTPDLPPGVGPQATPQAWMALQRAKAGLNNGDLTVRQLNNLRGELGSMKGKGSESKYIQLISKEINGFMERLPNTPGAVVKGNATQAISAWKEMNQHFMSKLKLDKMAEKLQIAQSKAATGKITFDNALQGEMAKWKTSKSGIKEYNSLFTEAERKAIDPLTEGTFTTQSFNRIDRLFAKGYLGNAIRLIRGSLAHMPAAQEAKQSFGNVIGTMTGTTAPNAVPGVALQKAITGGAIGGAGTIPGEGQEPQ